MSDRRLRELERQLAQGDAEAEPALLLERVRQGLLDPARLELAAYLGHPPARQALLERAPEASGDLEAWVRGLADWGPGAWVRAAVAAARLVLPSWEQRGLEDTSPQEALAAAQAWLREPTAERAQEAHACAELAQGVLEALNELAHTVSFEDHFVLMAEVFRETRAAVQAALSAAVEPERGATHAVLAAVAARERSALVGAPPMLHLRAAQVGRLGELPELNTQEASDEVRAAVRAALLPWALGDA